MGFLTEEMKGCPLLALLQAILESAHTLSIRTLGVGWGFFVLTKGTEKRTENFPSLKAKGSQLASRGQK